MLLSTHFEKVSVSRMLDFNLNFIKKKNKKKSTSLFIGGGQQIKVSMLLSTLIERFRVCYVRDFCCCCRNVAGIFN